MRDVTSHLPSPLVGEGPGERGKKHAMDKTQFARHLRATHTDVERLLWSRLRAHRFFGLKFKRQQPIGRYVVDFVCFEANLIIELDGGQHQDNVRHDQARDDWLRSQGFKLIRLWNNHLLQNLEGVLEHIAEHCQIPNPTNNVDTTTSNC